MSSSYSLKFIPTALKEWEKLDRSVQLQFKKKLAERLENPHVPAIAVGKWDKLDVYKKARKRHEGLND